MASSAARRLGYEAGGTIDMDVRVTVGDRTLQIVDTYVAVPPVSVSTFVARDISSTLALIERNDIDRPEIKSVETKLKVSGKVEMSTLESVVPSQTTVRPGDSLKLRVRLRAYRNRRATSVPMTVKIPEGASGTIKVIVAGGIEMDRRDADVRGALFPRNMDDLLGLLAERRPAKALFARVQYNAPGLKSHSEVMEALPPSARAVLGAGRNRTHGSLSKAVGQASTVPFQDVVVGSLETSITVVR